MVDQKTEQKITEIQQVYVEKLGSEKFLAIGLDYVKQLNQTLEKMSQTQDPNKVVLLADLYVWSKMILLSQDVSEDILDGQIDRLYDSVTGNSE